MGKRRWWVDLWGFAMKMQEMKRLQYVAFFPPLNLFIHIYQFGVSGSASVWQDWAILWIPFLKNGPTPASFLFIFYFSNKHYNFFTNFFVKKCKNNIPCRDSNPWPLGHESPPITTRPGLPHYLKILMAILLTKVAQISCSFLGYHHFYVNTALATFEQIGLLFIPSSGHTGHHPTTEGSIFRTFFCDFHTHR